MYSCNLGLKNAKLRGSMKIDGKLKRDYPKLAAWIELNLPKVKSKPKVWKAFLKYSELTHGQAKIALTKGHNPEIHFRIMPGANGEFRGPRFPNRVFLAKSICDKFEKSDMKKPKMHILLESTLLHEMVHWGDWADGKDQPGEEGKMFERAAYGQDINRYW